MSEITTTELFTRLLEIEAERERMKALYAEYDAIVATLISRGAVLHTTPDGQAWELRDNFATANTVFRPAGVKRFEFVTVKEPRTRRKKAA